MRRTDQTAVRTARVESPRQREVHSYLHDEVDGNLEVRLRTEEPEELGRSPAGHTLAGIGPEVGNLAGRNLAEDTGCKDPTSCDSRRERSASL